MSNLMEHFKDYYTYEALDLLDCSFKDLFSTKDELILELISNEVFHGEFLKAGRDRIDITNVTQCDTGNKLNGMYSFYRNEIARIKHLDHAKETLETEYRTLNIKLDKGEYFRIKEMTENYIFIKVESLQATEYSEAIASLSNVEQIGVVAPQILKRDAAVPVLILSTWKDIYIFDTSKLQPPHFGFEIKKIFESENICKIIHKGGPLLDILHRYYNIVPNNVFDTEVVDLIIQKNKNPDKEITESRNVFQCLEIYFNFPSTLKENFKLEDKPKKRTINLKHSDLVCWSQLVAYLIPLKETLTDILFSDIHKTLDNFCDYYSNIRNDFDYSLKFNVKKLSSDMQELIGNMSSLSLK